MMTLEQAMRTHQKYGGSHYIPQIGVTVCCVDLNYKTAFACNGGYEIGITSQVDVIPLPVPAFDEQLHRTFVMFNFVNR